MSDPYTEDPYDADEYGDTRGVHEEETDDAYEGTWIPYGGTIYPFSWPLWASDEDETYDDEQYDAELYDESGIDAVSDEDEAGWDIGVIGTLLLVGLLLFLIPEPTTSAVGIGLIALGLVAWLVDALT